MKATKKAHREIKFCLVSPYSIIFPVTKAAAFCYTLKDLGHTVDQSPKMGG